MGTGGGVGGVDTPWRVRKADTPHDPPLFLVKNIQKIIKNSIFQLNFDQKISKFSQNFPTIWGFVQTRKILPLGFVIYYRFTKDLQ